MKIIKLRISNNPETVCHGCDQNCCKPGGKGFIEWQNNFAGKEFEFYLPPVRVNDLHIENRCNCKFVWRMVSGGYCCEAQLELD